MTRREFQISSKHLGPFQKALSDFFSGKEPPSFPVKTRISSKTNEPVVPIPSVVRHRELGEVVIEQISLKPNENRERYLMENYPFLSRLYNQLEDKEKEKLLAYLETGGLVMLRRTRPSKEFKQALDEHCEKYHGGFALVTVLLEALDRLKGKNNGRVKSREIIPEAEEESLKNLEKNSQSAIHFYPLVQSGKKFKEAKKAIDKLNKLPDNFEFPYNVILTIAEIERGQTWLSSLFAVAGLLYGPLGEKISSHFGNFPSMVFAHGISEAFTMLMGAADRLKRRQKEEKETTPPEDNQREHNQLIEFFGFSGLVYNQLPHQVQKWVIKNVERFDRLTEAVTRTLTLAASVAIIIGGSYWASETENIIPFLLIAPANTSLVLTSEIVLRWKNARRIDRAVAEKIADMFSSQFLYKLAKKQPYLALAIQDFIRNQPALASWLGSLTSIPAIILLKNLYPQLPEEHLYGLSALFFEGGGAMLGKLFSETVRDPWKAFLKIVENTNK